jgi:hypothetical protein
LEVAVEEQEVDKEFFVCHFEAVSVTEEAETAIHSEDEILDIADYFFFEDAFVFSVSGTDEVHEVFVAEYLEG